MPIRLAQLRNDSGVVLGCLVISAIILGSLVIQKMTTAQSDKQAQQQQAAQLVGLADAQRRDEIEIEELIDRALEMLYGSPGKQFSLTKLFGNKSQRARLATVLIDTLQTAAGIDRKPQKNGAVTCHYFTASQPDSN